MSGENPSSDIYYAKYLKYKAKYLELKELEQSGGLLDSGFGLVFTSKANAAKLREAIGSGEISGKGDIADLLDRQAYIVFDGKKPAELLESTKRIMKDKLNAAAHATKSATSAAYKATSDAAMAAKASAMTQYNKYQEQKRKEAEDKAAFEQFKIQRASLASSVLNQDDLQPDNLQTGGAELPKSIPTLNNKSFDRANEAHKRHLVAAVANALELAIDDVAIVSIKFKMFGKPEIRD